METHSAFRVAIGLWKVLPPILIVLGNVGNILVILVLSSRKQRKSATSTYLCALALSDILALDTGLVRQWVKHAFSYDIRVDVSTTGCRVHWFVVYLVTQFSSWMLICVTLERLIVTWFPQSKHKLCSKVSSLILVTVILICLVLLNGHYLFGYGHIYKVSNNATTYKKCSPLSAKYETFVLFAWTWIDLTIFYLIPLTILATGNGLIVYKVLMSRRKAKRAVAPTGAGDPAMPRTTQQTRLSNLTMSLMLVCAVFMICIFPVVLYPIGEPYWEHQASDNKRAHLYLFNTIANLLMYVNHAINFILYFLSGTIFRNDVKALCLRRPTPVNSITQMVPVTVP